MKITYLGQCGFLLEGAGVKIVTDPYLSDYVDRNFSSEQTPWKRLYPAPTTLEALSPDCVLLSHAHADHMDPDTILPYLRAGGKAAFAAPAPETGALVDWGGKSVIWARAEEPFSIGRALITPVACAHTELHTDAFGSFRELSYLIDLGDGDIVFFGGDMSLYDGLEQRLSLARPTLLLLPANGRDAARTALDIIGNLTSDEAAHLSAKLNAPWIPMHHDLYAINRCPEGAAEEASARFGARVYPLHPMESLTLQGGNVYA